MSTLADIPYIPLEVGEHIIDQLIGDVRSLRSCALICRGWNNHARDLLMASIHIQSSEDLYCVCDYIASNPRMSSLVRSLSISPALAVKNARCLLEVLPVDLLKRLPNLQRYSIVGGVRWDPLARVSFHATTLLHFKTYLLVEELYLDTLEFHTSAELARVLIALPRLRHLQCQRVDTEKMTTDSAQFRDKCIRLSEVAIHHTSVHTVCLILQMSLSTLCSLRCGVYSLEDSDPTPLPDFSELKHLHSLELVADTSIKFAFDQIVPMIATLPPNKLRNLSITFRSLPRHWQTSSDQPEARHPLEDVISSLGIPSVLVSIPHGKHNRLAFWSKTCQRYFPRLHERKVLRVECSSGDSGGEVHLGHDAVVSAIAASPDGQYVATGAWDGTVIIWSGATSPQKALLEIQFPANSGGCRSLRFSDTGEFLAGIMCLEELLVWRVVDGVQITRNTSSNLKLSCAWQRHSLDHHTLSIFDWGIHEAERSAYLSVTKVHVLHSGTVVTSDSVSLSFDAIHRPCDGNDFIIQSSSDSYVAVWLSFSSRWYFWRLAESNHTYEMYQLYIETPDVSPTCASFVGDTTQFMIGFDDGTIRWWDIGGSWSPSSAAEPRSILSPSPKGCKVVGLSISPRHTFLVAWYSRDRSIPVLRRNTTLTAQDCLGDDFSPHVVLHGHRAPVSAVCFSPCERYIAATSRTIWLWSTRNGELLWTSRDHDTLVKHIVFAENGRTLASVDEDGRVCIRVLSMIVRDIPVPSVDGP
ncbi:WD40 repeat-like protein [Polyporus arcularius HHB13444]|uniref:WD40 repeat-like protein n=1 Tax=Polyporus arcularius HHB13444 TaxID=1314778 RepID=A0A5C3PQ32_9APHY|nr:WD40 repeat-like protein [Polyporus arcularius HHB13444]